MKGSKYRKAGKKPGGFDCSGLVQYVYGRMEMPMAASADAQSQQVKKIKAKNAKPGDLLFFGTKSRIQHVGIVTENEDDHFLMVHSSSATPNSWSSLFMYYFNNGEVDWFTPGDFSEDGILGNSKRKIIQKVVLVCLKTSHRYTHYICNRYG